MYKANNLANFKPNKKRGYQIEPLFYILKDELSVKYHVEKNDYFGTVATIISLISQNLKNINKEIKKEERKILLKILKNLEQDLNFLQNNYQIYIRPKTKNKKIIPKGRLKSQ